MNERRSEKRPAPGRRISIALAIAVHVALAAFLIYGVRWQSEPPAAVEVELVRSVPAPAAEPPPPAPEPEPEPKPEPPPPPKVEPKLEPPPPPKPDIVVKKEKEKPKPVPKAEPQPKWDPSKDLLEEERRIAEQKRLTAQVAAEQQRLDAQKAAQAAAARDKALAEYGDLIRGKIRGNIVLPPDIKGNPAAVFEVAQLPSGEVIDVRRIKPSGHAAYDDAVERAIHKSSPLPKPRDPADFQRVLKLTFCPNESGCN
jgi:colicin import membrane protein